MSQWGPRPLTRRPRSLCVCCGGVSLCMSQGGPTATPGPASESKGPCVCVGGLYIKSGGHMATRNRATPVPVYIGSGGSAPPNMAPPVPVYIVSRGSTPPNMAPQHGARLPCMSGGPPTWGPVPVYGSGVPQYGAPQYGAPDMAPGPSPRAGGGPQAGGYSLRGGAPWGSYAAGGSRTEGPWGSQRRRGFCGDAERGRPESAWLLRLAPSAEVQMRPDRRARANLYPTPFPSPKGRQ